jgi:uncharacterized protein
MADEIPTPAPLLSVRGEATLEVPPEIAELTITFTARDSRRERAMELLSARNEECLALVRSHGEAVRRVETTGLAIYPELRSGLRREQVRAYRGTVRVNVAVVDFTVLGDLIAGVSEIETAAVNGPFWRLRHDSPVRRGVRQEAARDAIVRAREYAEAVGARLTGLVQLADEGLTTDHGARAGVQYALAAVPGAPRGGAAEPPTIELEPQVQVVHARVEARFTISQPDQL